MNEANSMRPVNCPLCKLVFWTYNLLDLDYLDYLFVRLIWCFSANYINFVRKYNILNQFISITVFPCKMMRRLNPRIRKIISETAYAKIIQLTQGCLSWWNCKKREGPSFFFQLIFEKNEVKVSNSWVQMLHYLAREYGITN